jgi:hypothetical protein
MLRRLTLRFFLLAIAAAAAACSSGTPSLSSGGVFGSGPNFVTNTIYVANTTAQSIDLYTPSPGPSATPIYTISSNTAMNGPQYLAFDSGDNLWTTNYNASQGTASIIEFEKYATGNVLPFNEFTLASGTQLRGIAMEPGGSEFAVSATVPGGFYSDVLYLYSPTAGFLRTLAGTNTGLHVPSGMAFDANDKLYVANNGSASVTVYTVPTPSPTPSGSPSPTPSPTPTPTATPSGSPSATPSPSPTPNATNITPDTTIQGGSTGLVSPLSVALDASGNLYVADPDTGSAPRILVFDAPFAAGTQNVAPSRTITGSNTDLVYPTDVKVDSGGTIYVVDRGSGSNTSKLLIFAPGANGNVAPSTAIAIPGGAATGMALSP